MSAILSIFSNYAHPLGNSISPDHIQMCISSVYFSIPYEFWVIFLQCHLADYAELTLPLTLAPHCPSENFFSESFRIQKKNLLPPRHLPEPGLMRCYFSGFLYQETGQEELGPCCGPVLRHPISVCDTPYREEKHELWEHVHFSPELHDLVYNLQHGKCCLHPKASERQMFR